MITRKQFLKTLLAILLLQCGQPWLFHWLTPKKAKVPVLDEISAITLAVLRKGMIEDCFFVTSPLMQYLKG